MRFRLIFFARIYIIVQMNMALFSFGFTRGLREVLHYFHLFHVKFSVSILRIFPTHHYLSNSTVQFRWNDINEYKILWNYINPFPRVSYQTNSIAYSWHTRFPLCQSSQSGHQLSHFDVINFGKSSIEIMETHIYAFSVRPLFPIRIPSNKALDWLTGWFWWA